MSGLVLDASVTLSLLFDDELDPLAEATFALVDGEGGVVPRHWHYEVRNGLLSAVRRDRLTLENATQRLRSLSRFRLTTDTASDLDETWRMALKHGLTFYDALYLELAIRRRLALATLDGDLSLAAQEAGVDLTTA